MVSWSYEKRSVFVECLNFWIQSNVFISSGLRDIGKVLRRTHCILEVHDARIPFSGRNLNLIKRLVSNKPIILILNKSDLLSVEFRPLIRSQLMEKMHENNIHLEDIVFMDSIAANAKHAGYNNQFLSTILNSIEKLPNNTIDESDFLMNEEKSYNLLVMGIPNVGKSTIINRLRNVLLKKAGKATVVGAKAGVTRAVLERIKICDHPHKLYLFDTPGILEPSFDRNDPEQFMRCALCGTMSDEVIGKELIADYLLYWLNKQQRFDYVDFLGLSSPTNDIHEALTYAAIKYNQFHSYLNLETGVQEPKPSYIQLAEKFIAEFRKGNFGRLLLDIDMIETK